MNKNKLAEYKKKYYKIRKMSYYAYEKFFHLENFVSL